MPKTVDINVHHITRVEGHGNIEVKARDGKVEKVQWQVPEAPRFFEAMVLGRSYADIQTIVSRICGICSITHTLSAIKAIEDAMDIPVSEQTDRLRQLALYSEQLQSHILHAGYLVSPDLLGVKSVVPLTQSHPEAVLKIVKIHRTANNWSDLLVGRQTHPISIRPGGFSHLPTADQLKDLKAQLEDCIPDIKDVAGVVLSAAGALPAFERPTEYVSLRHDKHYTFYHGEIGSTDTAETVPVQQFESVINEYVVQQSTAKWCKWHRDSYTVGALARFNNNHAFLNPLAKTVAGMFGLEPGCCNPYFNTVAQIVEIAHVVEESLQLIDTLLTEGMTYEFPKVAVKAGNGAGCVEAPRGILFHRYAFDSKGRCESSNISIPTNQNHANIQLDFEKFVPENISADPDLLKLHLEMLVRSYDPCISCSTH